MRSNTQHITNEEVWQKITQAINPRDDLLSIVKKQKVSWLDRITGSSGLANHPAWHCRRRQEIGEAREDRKKRLENGLTSNSGK